MLFSVRAGGCFGEEQAMEKDSPSFYDPAGLYWPRVQLQGSEGGRAQQGDDVPHVATSNMCAACMRSDELYDLRRDPSELQNRIDDPAYAAVLSELRERMLTWYQTTCDVVPYKTDVR